MLRYKKKSYLCSFCSKLFEPKLIHNMLAREFLQRNCDNAAKLKEFAELIWPFFKKMFFYYRNSLELFNQGYRWTYRNYRNATYIDMNLQEIIDNDRYLIALNGPECFFAFTYSEYGS